MKFKEMRVKESGTSLPYLKIKDGERVRGVFKGNPHEFGRIGWGKDSKVVPFGTEGSTDRFLINFIVKEGASYVAKVWERGNTQYNEIKDLNEKYPLEETVVEIKRVGSGKDDTRYSILPLPPKEQPGEAGWKVINAVKLVDIWPKESQPEVEGNYQWHEPESFDEHPEIPF